MQTLQESITRKRALGDIPHYDRVGHIFGKCVIIVGQLPEILFKLLFVSRSLKNNCFKSKGMRVAAK